MPLTREDYSRAVRAMNDIRLTDKAAVTVILREDGGLFVSTVGTVDAVMELLDKYASYMESVVEKASKGGKQ